MWWYNILGDSEGIISHLLRLDPVTEGSTLLTAKIIFNKMETFKLILTVKRIN